MGIERWKVISVLIGASKVEHIIENVRALKKLDFTNEELGVINKAFK